MNSCILKPILARTFRNACLLGISKATSSCNLLQSRIISSNEPVNKMFPKDDYSVKESSSSEWEVEELDEQQFEQVFEELKAIDNGSMLGPQKVRVRSKKLHISQMEDENDSLSRSIKNWRKIIYDQGELDSSDLSKPPSIENPHPFDPSTLPPTHAISISTYVNHLPVLQKLLDLGVDLLDIDTNTKLGRELVKMNWDNDIRPKLRWLAGDVGVDLEIIGSYLTRNPYFLIQDLDNLKVRVNYLHSKKFKSQEIAKIVVENRYWLNMDVKTIDSRLGFMQRQFALTGNQIRQLIVKEPRVTMFGLGPIQRLILIFNQEWNLSQQQISELLLQDPRVFMMDPTHLTNTYNYITKVMKISIEQVLECPFSLRCPISSIRQRHEFLRRIKKDQYQQELPNYISLEMLLHPSDKIFAEKIARVFVSDYNNFLKTL